MKRAYYIWIGLVVVAGVLTYCCTPLRYYNPVLEGAGGSSDDISESKRRGVFLWAYKPEKNPIHIRDGEYLDIIEVWAERSWIYPTFSNETNIQPEHYQLVIRANPKGLYYYYERNLDHEKPETAINHWTIGTDSKRAFYMASEENLLYKGSSLPDSCEVFPIQQGTDLLGRKPPVLIGELKLCRQD